MLSVWIEQWWLWLDQQTRPRISNVENHESSRSTSIMRDASGLDVCSDRVLDFCSDPSRVIFGLSSVLAHCLSSHEMRKLLADELLIPLQSSTIS